MAPQFLDNEFSSLDPVQYVLADSQFQTREIFKFVVVSTAHFLKTRGQELPNSRFFNMQYDLHKRQSVQTITKPNAWLERERQLENAF